MITRERDGRVAAITMNRPAQRNALCTELVRALDEAFAELGDDPDAGAIVLTGAPPSGKWDGVMNASWRNTSACPVP